jgi:23S rRNA pseudouridine2605 synthase
MTPPRERRAPGGPDGSGRRSGGGSGSSRGAGGAGSSRGGGAGGSRGAGGHHDGAPGGERSGTSARRGGRKPGQRPHAAANRQDGRSAARPTRRGAASGPRIDVHVEGGERLQKVLAAAGLGSRRACEAIITAGRVTVDGVQVRELGVRIDPTRQQVHVDGAPILLDQTKTTVALNKPAGVVTTMADPEDRPTVAEYVYNRGERLFHVGRLDTETEGLLLLTNDGELANRLTHPSYEIPKTYVAQVEGRVPKSLGRQLKEGITLEDGLVEVDKFTILEATPAMTLVEIVIHSGRNRVVRRIFEEAGYPVLRLVRTQIGPILLGDLKPGKTRVLGHAELSALMADLGM